MELLLDGWMVLKARTNAPDVRASADESALDRAMGRYSEGDDAAFSVIYRAMGGRVRAFLLRMARRDVLADEMTQETFLRIHRARGNFAPGARAVPWVYAIARNVYVDYSRRMGTRRETLLAEDTPDQRVDLAADTESSASARQLGAIVEGALQKLPPNQKEAFILIRYEGLKIEEAAQILGVTEGAVKLRAFHAYEALRLALGDAAPKKRGAS